MEAFKGDGSVLIFLYAILPPIVAVVLILLGLLAAKVGRGRAWGMALLVPITLMIPVWGVLAFQMIGLLVAAIGANHGSHVTVILALSGLVAVEIAAIVAVPFQWKAWRKGRSPADRAESGRS